MGIVTEWQGSPPLSDDDGERKQRQTSYAEGQAARDMRLRPAATEALHRLREAEADLEWARDALAEAAARVLLDGTDEATIVEAEQAVGDAERAVARWRAARSWLDDRRGVVKDSVGNVL